MKAKPKFVAPKSLDKADEMLKARTEAFKVKSEWLPEPETWKEWEEQQAKKARRFPVHLTIEEISHIILAVEYVDMSEYCDNDILDKINAKLGSALASHYLGDL
jgi:hypothetical protein